MKHTPFLKKFSHYLLIGLSAMILLAGGQQMALSDNFQRGPNGVLAEGDNINCDDPYQYGCPEPDGKIGPGVPSPEQPAPAPEQPAPAPEQPAPQQPAYVCPKIDVVRTEQDCVGNQWCTFNIWQGPKADGSCQYGRGGAYGCQLVAGKCGYNPTTTPSCVPNGSCSAPAPACGQTSTGVDNCGNSCSRSGGACSVTPTSTVELPACPTPGQAGTVQQTQCGSQWSYNDFRILDTWSNGAPRSIYSEYSQNRHCQGTIYCAQPPIAQPAPICRNITTPDRVCIGVQSCTVNTTRSCDGRIISRSSPTNCQNALECGFRQPVPLPPAPRPPAQGVPAVVITQPHTQTQTVTTGPVNVTTGAVTQTVNVPAQSAPRETVREVRVVTAQADASGQVQGVQYKELPKTGLPLLAWTALAFIPAGFRLRRLGSLKKDAENTPDYLFEDRQFKMG